jgi:hypothetical protein
MAHFNNSNNLNSNNSNSFNVIAGRDLIYTTVSDSRTLAELLQPVPDAGYDREGTVSKCHPGTRADILGDIRQWIDDPQSPAVCWLSGPAGFGKSAVAHAEAEDLSRHSQLAGSFFFFRGSGSRSHIKHLIPTLAYQLAMANPIIRPAMLNQLRLDPTIIHKSLEMQFRHLLVNHTQSLRNAPNGKQVFIVDALDECDDRDLIVDLISVILTASAPGDLPFKMLLTSRIEEHIRRELEVPSLSSAVYRLTLESFGADLDIGTFLRFRFSQILEKSERLMQQVPRPWPSNSEMKDLLERCDGSFIFASTIAAFIGAIPGRPHENLRTALKSHVGLDSLYVDVLDAAPLRDDVHSLIGLIAVLYEPLPLSALSNLTGIPEDQAIDALMGIQSIIAIPESDDDPVRIIHTSLRDFLVNQNRSQLWWINPAARHRALMERGLTQMTQGSVHFIWKEKSLRYASRNWIRHLGESLELFDDVLHQSIDYFQGRAFFSWVNTLVSSGIVPQGSILKTWEIVLTVTNTNTRIQMQSLVNNAKMEVSLSALSTVKYYFNPTTLMKS